MLNTLNTPKRNVARKWNYRLLQLRNATLILHDLVDSLECETELHNEVSTLVLKLRTKLCDKRDYLIEKAGLDNIPAP